MEREYVRIFGDTEIHCNKKLLFQGLVLAVLGLLGPVLLPQSRMGIYASFSSLFATGDLSYLFKAAGKLVLMNVVRMTPHYMGTFLLNDALHIVRKGKREALPNVLFSYALILAVYATTSFSVIDEEGNMVACTKTINYGFGSKVVAEGYGFILNDEMDDFSPNPESTNCVAGGKRPLSSMSPSIVLYPDGKPFLTIGSPGATRIFPTVSQVIQRMIDYDMDIQDAIDCARIYDNAAENVCYESDGVTPVTAETAKKLEEMGHQVTDKGAWQLFFGGVQGIEITKDGKLRGGADPRRDGKALAY